MGVKPWVRFPDGSETEMTAQSSCGGDQRPPWAENHHLVPVLAVPQGATWQPGRSFLAPCPD